MKISSTPTELTIYIDDADYEMLIEELDRMASNWAWQCTSEANGERVTFRVSPPDDHPECAFHELVHGGMSSLFNNSDWEVADENYYNLSLGFPNIVEWEDWDDYGENLEDHGAVYGYDGEEGFMDVLLRDKRLVLRRDYNA